MSFPINDHCCGESAKGVNNCVWKRSHIRMDICSEFFFYKLSQTGKKVYVFVYMYI